MSSARPRPQSERDGVHFKEVPVVRCPLCSVRCADSETLSIHRHFCRGKDGCEHISGSPGAYRCSCEDLQQCRKAGTVHQGRVDPSCFGKVAP